MSNGEKGKIQQLSRFQDSRLKKVMDERDNLAKTYRNYRMNGLKSGFDDQNNIKNLTNMLNRLKNDYAKKEAELEESARKMADMEQDADAAKIQQNEYYQKLIEEQNGRLLGRITDLEAKLAKRC